MSSFSELQPHFSRVTGVYKCINIGERKLSSRMYLSFSETKKKKEAIMRMDKQRLRHPPLSKVSPPSSSESDSGCVPKPTSRNLVTKVSSKRFFRPSDVNEAELLQNKILKLRESYSPSRKEDYYVPEPADYETGYPVKNLHDEIGERRLRISSNEDVFVSPKKLS